MQYNSLWDVYFLGIKYFHISKNDSGNQSGQIYQLTFFYVIYAVYNGSYYLPDDSTSISASIMRNLNISDKIRVHIGWTSWSTDFTIGRRSFLSLSLLVIFRAFYGKQPVIRMNRENTRKQKFASHVEKNCQNLYSMANRYLRYPARGDGNRATGKWEAPADEWTNELKEEKRHADTHMYISVREREMVEEGQAKIFGDVTHRGESKRN